MELLRSRARRRASAIGVAVLAGTALLVAGCGGDDGASASSSTVSELARFLPAGSPLYADVSADLEGAQWTQAIALGKRFPGYEDAVADLNRELNDGDVTTADVLPLLGDRAAIGVQVDAASAASGGVRAEGDDVLGVVQLADEAAEPKMAQLLTRDSDVTKAGQHDGVDYYSNGDDTYAAITDQVLLIAEDEAQLFAAIDRRSAGDAETLAGVAKFRDAFADLPEDALARLYVDAGALARDAASGAPQIEQFGAGVGGLEDAAVAATLTAEPQGFRLKGTVTGAEQIDEATPFTPTLVDRVPGDALAYLGFADLAGQIERTLDQVKEAEGNEDLASNLEGAASQAEAFLGVPIEDLAALTAGEHAFFATNGALPSIGALLQVEDGTAAEATLTSVRQALPGLAALAGGGVAGRVGRGFTQVPLANGVTGWRLPIEPPYNLVYGVDGDVVLFGSDAATVRQAQTETSPLSESPRFLADTSGMPDAVTGLAWVDLTGAVKLIDRQGGFEGEPKARANLAPLRSAVAWSTGGDAPGFEAFVRIKE
jgi:hypothetical protein